MTDCIEVFKHGNQQEAERLLHVQQPTDVRATVTSFSEEEPKYFIGSKHIGLISLLHLAALRGWIEVVVDLITNYHCEVNLKDSGGRTPLHYAASSGHLLVVRYFIDEQNCDPVSTDNYSETPLHYSCRNNQLNITKYFISEIHCNPSCKNMNGQTPLYCACSYGNLETAQYLISEVYCNPACANNYGCTPLHIACSNGHPQIVHFLLSTNKVNPMAEDKDGETPIDYAIDNDFYDILKLFEPFQQCRKDFPVHTYTKVILMGYSGAGKTTVSQLIIQLTSRTSSIFSSLSIGRFISVESLTAGIMPLHVESKVKKVGNMVIYDFAGQHEYYSSHAAVLERLMKKGAAIFLCITDLSKPMVNISESIHYWLSFIESTCITAQRSSHVIIIGSHADMITSSQELREKSFLAKSIAESRITRLTYGGFVSMNCCQSKSKAVNNFMSLLSRSQQSVRSFQPRVSLYCHMLYAFLRTKLCRKSCTLHELTSALTLKGNFSLSSTEISVALTTLCDKGLIIFHENHQQPECSWLVVEKEALLKEVNGTLFAPVHFKQYFQIASNTGIVTIQTLHRLFPQHSTEILVGALESMEFCHPVNPFAFLTTNLECIEATEVHMTSEPSYLFFPSLVKEHRPSNLPSPKFGWCLGCSDPHQFFTTRLVHVLLLRLAFTFPLASEHLPSSSSLHGLERQCQVWRNGISWKNVFGVTTIVDILDHNRWVIVMASKRSRKAAEVCSSVIRLILNIQEEFGRVLSVCECFISPSLLERYPFDVLPDTDLFSIHNVARSMLLRHDLVLDRKEGKNELQTQDCLLFEPYYRIKPASVCQLFSKSMADQPVPASLLKEVLGCCEQSQLKPQDHKQLRMHVDKQSVFVGRNPLVSSACNLHVIVGIILNLIWFLFLWNLRSWLN